MRYQQNSWRGGGIFFGGSCLGVALFSAVDELTSSQIGPFNAPCSNLNIPTRAINPNSSVKTFNKEQSENLSKTLTVSTVYIVSMERLWKWILRDLGWFGSLVQLAGPCRPEATVRPTVEAHRCRYYHLLSGQVHANLVLPKCPLSNILLTLTTADTIIYY